MLHAVHMPMFDQYTMHFPTPWPDVELRVGVLGFFEGRGNFDWRQNPGAISLHIVLDGRGHVASDGESPVPARTGDVFVFWPGLSVHYWEEPDAPWRYMWMHLHGRRAREVLETAGIRQPRMVFPAQGHGFLDVAADWRAQAEADSLHAAAAMSFAWDAVGLLHGRGESPLPRRPDVVDACRAYLDAYYMNPICIEDVARHCGVDRTTLFRHFRDARGESPKQYLQALRLDRAKRMLLDPSQTVVAVAEACGFNSPAYFARVFRQATGQSPSQWRHAPA